MEYIKEQDYEYLKGKYHDPEKPYDSLSRFHRRDEYFAENSGMAPEAILEGILEQDALSEHLPHPVRKANAFAFVLKNTRISCDARDRFPAIHMVDRPLNQTVIAKWKSEVFSELIPEVEKRRAALENAGIVTIWPDYDHSVPVWDRVFELGFSGLLEESEAACQQLPEQKGFFDGIRITYLAIIDFIGRLAELAGKTPGSERMAEALSRIQSNAPSTFYEVLLTDYIYFMLSEHIEGLQVRALCNFDRHLYRFYKNDLANGVPEEEIRRDLAYFMMQFTAIDNYWNQPVYLGGCEADGSTVINELSWLFLDVYDKMGIFNPKIQIKLADSTPKDFVLKALDMIRRGNSSIVFVSDALIRKALVKFGATEEEARTCDIKGCYEYAVQGSMECGMNYINLLKPMEYALHKGCDGVTGRFAGLESPDVSQYTDFDDFYQEYKRQLKFLVDQVVDIVNGFEDYLAVVNPQSMLSATYPSCLKTGKDALAGGALYNDSSVQYGFIADIADSMAMIKKYVFDRKELTLAELRDILDQNFEGQEHLRRKLLLDREKYGNNRELPDYFAKDIADFAVASIYGRPNAPVRGGKWTCGFHIARQRYTQAPFTATSPNGRLVGEELSANLSASAGQNREGATAAILSITKIDASNFTSDACLDLGLLPSAVKGEDGLEAMYGLLDVFMKRGGHALQFNVFDADTLRAAQEYPEKYQDLQIRVSGWNVLFNNISKEEQDGFIKQAESLI